MSPTMFYLRITVGEGCLGTFLVKGSVWVAEGAGVEKMVPPSCMAEDGGGPCLPLDPQDPPQGRVVL